VSTSLHRAAAAALMMYLIAVAPVAQSASRPGRERLLGAISIGSTSINPSSGEMATLHVSLARAARIDVQVLDRDGFAVRALVLKNGVAGDNLVVWDGPRRRRSDRS